MFDPALNGLGFQQVVPEGHKGLYRHRGEISEKVYPPGTHWVGFTGPVGVSEMEVMKTHFQVDVREQIRVPTKDGHWLTIPEVVTR